MFGTEPILSIEYYGQQSTNAATAAKALLASRRSSYIMSKPTAADEEGDRIRERQLKAQAQAQAHKMASAVETRCAAQKDKLERDALAKEVAADRRVAKAEQKLLKEMSRPRESRPNQIAARASSTRNRVGDTRAARRLGGDRETREDPVSSEMVAAGEEPDLKFSADAKAALELLPEGKRCPICRKKVEHGSNHRRVCNGMCARMANSSNQR